MSSFTSASVSAVAGFAREAIPHRGGLPLRLLSLEGRGAGAAAHLQSTLGTSIELSGETATDSSVAASATNVYNYQLCDIGANLCDTMYAGEYNDKKRHPNDLLAVLQRARATNVSKILCTAGSVEDSRRTLQLLRTPVPVQWRSQAVSPSLDDLPELASSGSGAVALAEQYGLYMTVGVHPTRAALFLPDDAQPLPSGEGGACSETAPQTGSRVLDELLSIIVDANGGGSSPAPAPAAALDSGEQGGKVPRRTVVALGECGLDYARLEFCSKEQQLAGFRLQLQLASHPLVDLPLFLHSRDTEGDFLRVMRESRHLYARRGGVVHSFDGTVEEMLALCELGLYIGINGCSLRTEEQLRNVVPAIPADRLLLETDAPWCSIKRTHPSAALIRSDVLAAGQRKKEKWEPGYLVKDRNEPLYLHQVAEVVAHTRGVTVEALAEQCWRNSERLFFYDR